MEIFNKKSLRIKFTWNIFQIRECNRNFNGSNYLLKRTVDVLLKSGAFYEQPIVKMRKNLQSK